MKNFLSNEMNDKEKNFTISRKDLRNITNNTTFNMKSNAFFERAIKTMPHNLERKKLQKEKSHATKLLALSATVFTLSIGGIFAGIGLTIAFSGWFGFLIAGSALTALTTALPTGHTADLKDSCDRNLSNQEKSYMSENTKFENYKTFYKSTYYSLCELINNTPSLEDISEAGKTYIINTLTNAKNNIEEIHKLKIDKASLAALELAKLTNLFDMTRDHFATPAFELMTDEDRTKLGSKLRESTTQKLYPSAPEMDTPTTTVANTNNVDSFMDYHNRNTGNGR